MCVRLISDDNDDVCAFVVVFVVALVFVLDSQSSEQCLSLVKIPEEMRKKSRKNLQIENLIIDRFQFRRQQPPADNTRLTKSDNERGPDYFSIRDYRISGPENEL